MTRVRQRQSENFDCQNKDKKQKKGVYNDFGI